MPLSLRARLMRKLVWQMRARADRVQTDIDRLRKDFEFAGRWQPKARGVRISHRVVEGVPVEVLTPKVRNPRRVLMYLHGGGYVIGSPSTHRPFTTRLARALAAEVWVPDYRLAPEHPFPAAQEDILKVWPRFVAEYPGAVHLLAGESAGGGLSVATSLRLREAGGTLPDALYLISPWLDVSLGSPACSELDARDALLGRQFTAQVFAGNYCPADQHRDPLVSPLFADPAGLPPMLVQAGGDEILRDDSRRFVDKVKAAGGEVRYEESPQMWHAWVLFAMVVPEARQALASALRWLRAV